MEQQFVFVDIDGTLYDHTHECIPSSALQAINDAVSNGHKLFLCTGRNQSDVGQLYSQLPFSGMIFSSGAQIVIQSENVHFHAFPIHSLNQLIEYLREHSIQFALETPRGSFFDDEAYQLYQAVFESFDSDEIFSAMKMDRFTEQDYEQVTKITLIGNNDASVYLNKLNDSFNWFFEWDPHFQIYNGEINLKGVSKASALQYVCQYFNHPIENTIAIGDSLNDLEMIKYAHIGISMKNGSKTLQENADYVTDYVYNDGLYKAFKHFHLI